ncbi:hypothetical protein [Paraburkholderia sp. 31.1]|uniref:hypothetical protein n=1 Tax=Paraburkholderia sp. 31.1 TaxID=2615205 RepID=UPI00223B812A|nr:hypothetical protein [Paraburkholderia sp. 31.1]
MLQIVDLPWHEHYSILTLTLFTIFMAFRLRAITAAWLVGLCVASYLLMLYLQPPGERFGMHLSSVIAHGTSVPLTYAIGLVVSIPLERSARREFMYQRNLRAAKARVEAASRIRDEHAVERDLDVIQETASDILDMFKDIQDYSELGSYVPRLTSVNTLNLLTEVLEQYRQTAQLRGIDLRLARRRVAPPSIETDRSPFKRAIFSTARSCCCVTTNQPSSKACDAFSRARARLCRPRSRWSGLKPFSPMIAAFPISS